MKKLARGLGFEPRFTESESAVLPLDDPRKFAPANFPSVFYQLFSSARILEVA